MEREERIQISVSLYSSRGTHIVRRENQRKGRKREYAESAGKSGP